MRQGIAFVCAVGLVVLLAGCSGAVHQVPRLSPEQVSAAEADVLAEPGLETRRSMSLAEASQTMGDVIRRLHPAAQAVCREVGVGNCHWRYSMARDRSLNAYATAEGRVVLHRGLAELTANDDEIALVLAHELGHQVANHPNNTQRNAQVGALLGGVLGGALDMAAAVNGSQTYGSFSRLGSSVGLQTGALSYSKEQEREADYLGVVIAYRAGVDLDKARAVMLSLARASGKRESGTFDSHPMGAERLAGFDRAVAEVRASNGALPPRAK